MAKIKLETTKKVKPKVKRTNIHAKSKTSKLLKAGITEPITEMTQGQVLETAKQITQEFTGVDKDENM